MKKLVRKALTNEKGLTLIELLAVVVILGIIAAIAVPMIGSIIQDSRDKAFASEALNVISAAKIAQAAGEGDSFASATNDLQNYITLNLVGFETVAWNGTDWAFTGLTNTGGALPTGITATATETELSDFAQGN